MAKVNLGRVVGKSAYEIWQEEGNAGSEQDFLNSLKGQDGTNGINGQNGTNGQDGKSAYQIWLDNGNTGTEQDFLNSLKGQNGTNGQDGVSPSASVTGNQNGAVITIIDRNGTTTAQITNGINGTNGTNGQDGYTPVRGTDYWTSEDISQIENHCDEYTDEKISNLQSRVEEVERLAKSHNIYGIRRAITDNSSPKWERILNSVGKVAKATKNGDPVQNDFDNLAPWSEIKSCNYDLSTKEINAWFGDPNFKFDGTNGDVFTYIPKTYWNIFQEDGYDYVLLSDTPQSNFIEIDDFFIGRYDCTDISGVLHSYSGLIPTTNRNITQFRNYAQNLGQKFSQLDWRYFVIQMIYLVEYATYDCQSVLGNGIMSRNVVNTLIAESSTNRVVIADATNFYVGQIIRVGTAANGAQIIMDRKITAIAAYDDGSVTGYALTFSGASANIAVGNYVSTCVQQTGQCDSLGMKSGCLNDDGYHSVIYRGMENIYSDVYQFIDGINTMDSQVYFCKDHSQYQTNYYEAPYNLLPYVMYIASNGWVKTLGFAETEPLLRLPTDIGGSSSTYMCDYYVKTTGSANLRVGGCSSDGQKNGFWALIIGAPAGASWDRGARILIDGE